MLLSALHRPGAWCHLSVRFGAPALDPLWSLQIQKRLLVATTAAHRQMSTNASTP
jgi:hypothetical protein